ncbi:DUF3313 family protein [Caballeronia zhejiangensis]|uniref:DUF3313 family protein n=1 Tax=Caballeronia zhejiangensis TaxID=871203 RepID=UPI001FD1F703|nr:DUF3313 family protein [Caballeronia zhejiangensis]
MYPKAEPTDQLSQATIDQIRGYGTTCLKQAIGSRVRVVEAPAPGVTSVKQIALFARAFPIRAFASPARPHIFDRKPKQDARLVA